MADDAPAPERMGWQVPSRTGARVLIVVPLLLLVALSLAVWFYDWKLRPGRMQPVTPFPAPGIETYVHPGQGDPDMAAPRPDPDPQVTAAMREVAAEGLPGWPAAARGTPPGGAAR